MDIIPMYKLVRGRFSNQFSTTFISAQQKLALLFKMAQALDAKHFLTCKLDLATKVLLYIAKKVCFLCLYLR